MNEETAEGRSKDRIRLIAVPEKKILDVLERAHDKGSNWGIDSIAWSLVGEFPGSAEESILKIISADFQCAL